MRTFNVTTKDELNPETLNQLRNKLSKNPIVTCETGYRRHLKLNTLMFTQIRHQFTNYDQLIRGVTLSNDEYISITNQVGDILKIVLPNEIKNISNWVSIRNSKVNNRSYVKR